MNFQVQYRSSGAKFNISILQLQDELAYYCYRWSPRREKRNLLYAMSKIKEIFFYQFVIGYFLYDTLCIVRVDQKEPGRHNLKWAQWVKWQTRVRSDHLILCTETISVVDTLNRKKTVWILHFKLACPEISEQEHYWRMKQREVVPSSVFIIIII